MNEQAPITEKWKNSSSYIITILCWSTSLNNIFHSPKFLLEIGFINYFLLNILIIILVGIPMTLMELEISQYCLKSIVRCWDLCPFFRGIGYGKLSLIIIFQVYYNVLNSFILFHCYNSMLSEQVPFNINIYMNTTEFKKIWYTEILNSEKNNTLDPFNWKLTACLCLHMVLMSIIILQEPKVLETILLICWNTSIFGCILLLCISNITPGGLEGVKHVIFKKLELNYFSMWNKDGLLIKTFQYHLYSMALSFGGFSALAAQGIFRRPLYSIAVWANLANFGTSIVYGIIFSNFYGIVHHNLKLPLDELPQQKNMSQDLSFIFSTLPSAFNYNMNIFWKVVLYLNFYLKGLSTALIMYFILIKTLQEEIPNVVYHPKLLVLFYSIFLTLSGCSLLTNIGFKASLFFSNINLKVILPLITTFQVIAIIIYGIHKYIEDLYFMLGTRPSIYWCLTLFLSFLIIPVFALISIEHYFMDTIMGETEIILLKTILSGVLVWIPFMGMVRIIRKVKINMIFQSANNWGPPNGLNKSRKMFQEQHSIEEFIYEKYLLERKLKKYE